MGATDEGFVKRQRRGPRGTLTPTLPSLDKLGTREEARLLIAAGAGVGVSRRELNRYGGRSPASHGHGDE
jgi:hypothetical protein